MSYILGSHFDALFDNIRPAPNRIEAAKTLPGKVRSFLEEHAEFETVDPHSRLVGSYAQRLSVGDVKDVDFLVMVDGDPEANDPDARTILRELRSTLDELPEYLGLTGYAATAISVERARRSVHIYFVEEDFHLDVVPCIAPKGVDSSIWVPDHGFERWIESDPLGVVRVVRELNNDNYMKFRRMTKLLKHFRNHHMVYRRPKSYWLVAMAIDALRNDHIDMTQSIGAIFADLVDHLYCKYAPIYGRDGVVPHIPDPMLGHDISWNWSRTHFETFMRRLADARTWTQRAFDASNKEDAIENWQKVFGAEYFPADVEDRMLTAAGQRQPGLSSVTRSGLIVPGTIAHSIPVRPTRFYGGEEQ